VNITLIVIPLVEFGKRVRSLRRAQGLTEEQLAEAADLNPRTVQKIEAGQINILLTTLVRIQSALNCTAGELFGEEGSLFLKNSLPTSGAEPELTQQSKKTEARQNRRR
jgi:transcriptional regulator with XRE-family HTH domain